MDEVTDFRRVTAHYRWVMRCAWTLSFDDADDLTQETFRLAWIYRHKIGVGDKTVKGFLHRILMWKWQRHLRSRYRLLRRIQFRGNMDTIAVQNLSFGDRACDDWDKYVLTKKLANDLSPPYKEIFERVLANHYHGLMIDNKGSGLSEKETYRFNYARRVIRRKFAFEKIRRKFARLFAA